MSDDILFDLKQSSGSESEPEAPPQPVQQIELEDPKPAKERLETVSMVIQEPKEKPPAPVIEEEKKDDNMVEIEFVSPTTLI